MNSATFTVKGMTCGHCVNHVTEEITKIPGVISVDITLDTGAVTINSTGDIDKDAVKAAVIEAGYELV